MNAQSQPNSLHGACTQRDVSLAHDLPAALDVLVLADTTTKHINTIRDHLAAFEKFSRHRVVTMDYRYFKRKRRSGSVDFGNFDAVVLHYSVIVSDRGRLSSYFREQLAAFAGLKIIFIQDEYRWIDATAAGMASCEFHVIFSVVNEEIIDRIYRHPALAGVRKEITLTGFVPTELLGREVPRYADRAIDVGYRARRVPSWLGSFAHEKWLIGQKFGEAAKRFELTCDIESDEHKRIYGEAWIAFTSNCKAMLGTESGASVCDFDGTLQARVEAYEAANKDASFEEVRRAVLADVDGALTIQVISPRCFEAAALRTLMILYPGAYSGRLTPWRHYVPLERDFSNLEEVVAVLRDPLRAESIIESAYREVACNKNNTFEGFVEHFDRVVDEEFSRRAISRTKPPAEREQIEQLAKRFESLVRVRAKLILTVRSVVFFVIDRLVPREAQPKVMAGAQSVWRSLFR